VETAKENGLNLNTYLTWLFGRLANIDIENKEALDVLLPWSPELPDYCKLKN